MVKDIEKIQKLAEQILFHKKAYYEGNPQISDYEYDKLEEELRKLDPNHPVLEYVGFDISDSKKDEDTKKATHSVPMLSLDKTYNLEDLKSWIDDQKVVGTLKIDGNSLAIVYNKGKLSQAKTRGNGKVGEDVTDKALWVNEIMHEIDFEVLNKYLEHKISLDKLKTAILEIRGELYCKTQNFLTLCEEMISLKLEKPTSPRNIVAGLLGRKGFHFLARHFSFAAFDILVFEEDGKTLMYKFYEHLKFEIEKLNLINKLGFNTPGYKLLSNFAEVQDYLEYVKEIMEADDFGVDGAVFTYNDLSLHQSLGSTAHHPRYKLSFKWQGQTAISTIRKIQWSTSRLGIVTPVAIIDPVYLSGATITNITLHNLAHVKAYNIKVNDKIEIVRSGEVIPKFLRVVESNPHSTCEWPKKCPSCESDLIDDGVRLICTNSQTCPAQHGRSILNWINTVGIDDLSEKRLEQLLNLGLVNTIPDLYKLKIEDFLKLPLTKEKMAKKLYNNIQKTKNIPLAVFLAGLGIPHAGLTTWEKLLEYYPTLNDILNLDVDDIVKIEGFALKSAQQIIDGIKTKKPLIEKLLAVGVVPIENKLDKSSQKNLLQSKQFVITGELSQPRSHYETLIKNLGGKLSNAVSKNTYALICNNLNTQSTKMKKAKELNIPIWSEKEFLNFIEQIKQQTN